MIGLRLPGGCEAVGLRRVLLPELDLDWSCYPRQRLDRRNVEHLLAVLKSGGRWWTPLVVDGELRLLDGWHRVHALREFYGDDAVRLEVEVLEVRCEPRDRLLVAALLNRWHGARLSDEDAARCAAALALSAPDGNTGAAVRRLARDLAVSVRMVRRALRGLSPREERARARVRLPLRPDLVWDPRGMTPAVAVEVARWLDDTLSLKGRELFGDPTCAEALRQLFRRLGRFMPGAQSGDNR